MVNCDSAEGMLALATGEIACALCDTGPWLEDQQYAKISMLKIGKLYSQLPVALIGFRAGSRWTEKEKSHVGPFKMGNDQA